jgi:hypothetical protein
VLLNLHDLGFAIAGGAHDRADALGVSVSGLVRLMINTAPATTDRDEEAATTP